MPIGPRVSGLSNMKFWWVAVMDGYKTLFNQRCMSIDEANALVLAKKEEFDVKNNRNINVYKELY